MQCARSTDAQTIVKAARHLLIHEDVERILNATDGVTMTKAAAAPVRKAPAVKRHKAAAVANAAHGILVKRAAQTIVVIKHGNMTEKQAAVGILAKLLPLLVRLGAGTSGVAGRALGGLGGVTGKIGGLGGVAGKLGRGASGMLGGAARAVPQTGRRAGGLGALLAGGGMAGGGAMAGRASKPSPKKPKTPKKQQESAAA